LVSDPKILKELQGIVGEEHATSDTHIMYAYSYDMSFVKNRLPAYVVMPQTVEEIQQIMKLANKTKTPVIPYTAGSNIGGLCIPEKDGSIVMDLKRMNKIIRIDEESRYAVVEPGVSHAELAEELYKRGLRFGWPVGPPSASVLSCAICHGIGGITGRYGLNSEQITSMEVVLPTGELTRVGSCAIQKDAWHSLLPLPLVGGLFTGWLGTTGVVTKLGIFTPAIPPYVEIVTTATDDLTDMYKYMLEFSRYEAADDLTAVSWWLSQVPIPYPFKEKPKDAPEWNSYAVLYAYTEKELEAKKEMFETTVKNQVKNGSSLQVTQYPEEAKRARTELPSQIVGSTKNYSKQAGGGISWPGTFTPANKWVPIWEKWKEIYEKRNLSPSVRVTMYRGTHYGMLRAMTPLNKQYPDQVENARMAIVEALRVLLDNGGIPYKPPVDFAKEIYSRADPGYVELIKRIKDFVDPNQIMNPGKLWIR
jgi:glycolate oxidase